MRWTIDEQKTLLKTHPFHVEELKLSENGVPTSHPYYRILTPDWVNVLPINEHGEAILIRQDRVGAQSAILETPGGVVEKNEMRDPTVAAIRELEEETGYTSSKAMFLGSINPNPALHVNKVHFFLALNSSLNLERKHFPDPEEKIEVVKVKTNELSHLVRTGQMDHSLSALCIFMARKYIDIGE